MWENLHKSNNYINNDSLQFFSNNYEGPDESEDESKKDFAAAIRANHPISQQYGLFYFEINIVNKRENGYVTT